MVVRDGSRSYRFGAACVLLAVVVFSVLYVIAASQDPDYEFLENYLSDLGVGPAGWAFNSALMLSGALILIFAYAGLRPLLGVIFVSKAGSTMLAAAGVFLVNVGIFTEDYGDIHLAFSLAFFLTLLAALGFLAYALHVTKALGLTGTAASVSAFVFGLLLLVMGIGPLAETLAVLTALGWGSVVGILMLLRAGGMRIP